MCCCCLQSRSDALATSLGDALSQLTELKAIVHSQQQQMAGVDDGLQRAEKAISDLQSQKARYKVRACLAAWAFFDQGIHCLSAVVISNVPNRPYFEVLVLPLLDLGCRRQFLVYHRAMQALIVCGGFSGESCINSAPVGLHG